MNVTIKRSVSFLLALVMVFSLVPGFGLHAHAEELPEDPAVQYTVRFLDEDGTELQSSLVDEGAIPEYTGEPLYKEGFAFVGWEPEVTAASADAEYVAVYTEVLPASGEPENPEQPENPENPEQPENPVVPEDPQEPEIPAEPEYSDAYLEIQGKIDEMLTWYLGGTQATQAEIEAAVAGMNVDEIWMAQVEAYDIIAEAEAALAEEELMTWAENNKVFLDFLNELNQQPAHPNMLADLSGWSNANIGMSYVTSSNDSSWVYKDGVITGKSAGKWSNNNSTLTIENKSSSDNAMLTLKFGYSRGSGKLVITNVNAKTNVTYNSKSSESNLTYTTTLNAGDTVTVRLESGTSWTAVQTTQINITAVSLALPNANIDTTFEAPAYGSYTVAYGTESKTISAGADSLILSNSATTAYTLTATPGDGNKFVGWKNLTTGKYISMETDFTGTFADSATIKPIIVTSDTPVFAIGTAAPHIYQYVILGTEYTYYTVSPMDYFIDLNEAAAAAKASSANKYVVLISNGTLPTGNYEIPSGVTLLIPYEGTYTSYLSKPKIVEIPQDIYSSTPKHYGKLTLAPNAKIKVKGAIEVASNHYAAHGGKSIGGVPVSAYGQIDMGSNSSITLESGGKLYAWGYVTGSGSVTATSNSTIYEKMQVTDYRGGDRTDKVVGDGVFPFNQYYIQNVEVSETIEAGATLVAHAGIYANWIQEASVDFMGGSSAMFALTSGSVTKHYDASKDRLILDVNGDVTMNPITLLGKDTANFNLPLNQNITINLKSGYTATINQSLMLQPGATINVDSGATLSLIKEKNVYLMSTKEWGNYCWGAKQIPVRYVGSRAGAPVSRELEDAKMNVNGTVAINGALYTSASGTPIVSPNKTGEIVLTAAAPAATTIKQTPSAGEDKSAYKYDNISVKAAVLTNGDGTTVSTEGTTEHTTYKYCATHDCWYTGACHYSVTFDANGGTGTMTAVTVKKGASYTLPACTFTRTGYDFAGWDAGTSITVTGDTTVKATWKPKEYSVTFDANGGTGTMGPVAVKYNETYTLPECTFTNTGYDFQRWEVNGVGKAPGETITVTANTTVKAIWVAQTFEVSWMNGTERLLLEEVAYNTQLTCKLDNPAKAADETYHYTFAGWSTTENGATAVSFPFVVTGKTTFYAVFTPEAHDFTNGNCACGAEKPVTNINVIVKGSINYTVDGNVVTVTHTAPCKVGYWDAATSKYVAIAASANTDGSYSFTAPEGVTEVLLVMKGDVTQDGKLNAADTGKLNSYVLTRGTLTEEAKFASEVTGDGKYNAGDTGKINATILNRATLTWG